MAIVEYVKEHPYATGAIVVIGGFLFYIIAFSGGSSSSPQVINTGPSEGALAANAAVAAAQAQASGQAAQAAAAVKAAEIGAGVQLNSDNLAAQIAMTNLEYTRDIEFQKVGAIVSGNNAQVSIANAQIEASKFQAAQAAQVAISQQTVEYNIAREQANVQKLAIQTDGTVQLSGIDASKITSLAGIDANKTVAITTAQLAAETQQFSDAKTAEIAMAGYAMNTALIQSNQNVQMSLINSQSDANAIAGAVQIASINSATNTNLAYIDANKEITLGQINTSYGLGVKQVDAATAVALGQIASNENINVAQIGAQTTMSNNAAAVSIAQFGAEKDVAVAAIAGQVDIAELENQRQLALQNTVLNVIPYTKKNKVDNVTQALITGEQFHGNGGQGGVAIANAVGNAVGGLSTALMFA